MVCTVDVLRLSNQEYTYQAEDRHDKLFHTAFCCCDKQWPRATLGGQGLFQLTLRGHNLSLRAETENTEEYY